MTKTWKIRRDRSFRENGRTIVPLLLERFLSQADDVRAHPESIRTLHRMRIDGKRVRYGMEIFTAAFGEEYAACLEAVKALLDIMGTIHDCDVHIPALGKRIERVRARAPGGVRRTIGDPGGEALAGCMRELHRKRDALFGQMDETLARWQEDRFAERVAHSMRGE